MSCLLVGAQVRPMTIDEVDSLASRCNLQLEAARFELNAAEGQLVQAKKRDNPELQLMHNVQNLINRKWFESHVNSMPPHKLLITLRPLYFKHTKHNHH